jgi:tetratricopeptide (TPR) repeat protein
MYSCVEPGAPDFSRECDRMGERDPEQMLVEYDWRFDPDTLREVHDEASTALFHEIRAGLTERLAALGGSPDDDRSRARLLSLRAAVARSLGDLGPAKVDGIRAVAYAEAVGDLRLLSAARARLAHVLQWLGEFEMADRLFALADSPDLPDRARAANHQHAGKCAFDQGRYIEAVNHFERALELRRDDPDPRLLASTEIALDGLFRKVAEHGWGPYARPREEILGTRAAPEPTYSEPDGRWGYVFSGAADGDFAIGPSFADAQPFADGLAWVRSPDVPLWTLIDDEGAVLIGPSGGLDEVRPFRRGLAAVARRGRFATALHDGRYVDGFSDGGYAVVHRSGRSGVIDHTGRLLVPPEYAAVVLHPLGFLVSNGLHWGALDRRGKPLIDLAHPSRTSLEPLLITRGK